MVFTTEDLTIATKNKQAPSPDQLKDIVVDTLDNNKAEDIVSIDLRGKTSLADHMIICTGRSSRQVSALANKVDEILSQYDYKSRMEGRETGDWVVVDAGDIVVHIFRPEVREFYKLEKMWQADFDSADHTLYISA